LKLGYFFEKIVGKETKFDIVEFGVYCVRFNKYENEHQQKTTH